MNQPQNVRVRFRYVSETRRTTFAGHVHMPTGSTLGDLNIAISQKYPDSSKLSSFNAFADWESLKCNYHLSPDILVENLNDTCHSLLILKDVNDRTEVGFSEKLYLEEVEDILCDIAKRLAKIYQYPHNPQTAHRITDLLKAKDDNARENWDYVRYTEDQFVEDRGYDVRKGDPIANVSLPDIYDRAKWNHIEKMNTLVKTGQVPPDRDSAMYDLKQLNRIASEYMRI
jgi:hypothetical protein